MNTTNVYQWSD